MELEKLNLEDNDIQTEVNQDIQDKLIKNSSESDSVKTPYQIVRNAITTGDIKDILELTQEFYEELKTVLEDEEEYEDEPSTPKEIIIQLMSDRFESCSNTMEMNEILKKVGYDSPFAEDYANHIEADPLDMSLWEWIEHFVVLSLDRLVYYEMHE